MGIWGLETDFGDSTGDDNVIRALASLAFVHFRGDYFRDELLSALVILQEGEVEPRRMLGSWAGAMGQTQFMPSSYLAYAVDFEGEDGATSGPARPTQSARPPIFSQRTAGQRTSPGESR